MNLGQISNCQMTYTRSQTYTNMVVGKHGIQVFEVVIVVFDVFVPTSAHPPFCLDK